MEPIINLIIILVVFDLAILKLSRKRRAIRDTPTSLTASAAQGYAELKGVAKYAVNGE